LAATISHSDVSLSPQAKCLVQNLQYLNHQVDSTLFNDPPWYSWEKFGACFFAMRINSLLLRGHTRVPFAELCKGAVMNGCFAEVMLAPMEVHSIEEELSIGMRASVTERVGHRTLNWVDGDRGVRYCLVNGTGGKGVDFFSALPLADGGGAMLLYTDQRKAVATALGARSATALLDKAHIVPQCLPAGLKYVRGLFSTLASFNGGSAGIPQDCCVLSYRQHTAFHGSMSLHPACKTWIDMNYDNVSSVRLLKSIAPIATEIVKQRDEEKFASVVVFAAFCKERGHNLSDEDQLRVVAEAHGL
jgi:hypothetical protein